MPTGTQVVHAHGFPARFSARSFDGKSAYLRSAAPIEDSSGSRRRACLNVLMTLMRWGSAPLKLPPPLQFTFNNAVLTFPPS